MRLGEVSASGRVALAAVRVVPGEIHPQRASRHLDVVSRHSILWRNTRVEINLQGVNFFFFCLFAISWAAPSAYGGSQARGPIGAVVTGLHQSHSNAGSSEPRLQPTPQLTATPDH